MALALALPILKVPAPNVVVDGSHRGEGIGRRLLEDIIRVAQDRRMRTLDLSSRPSRQAAIGLYESLGFVNVGLRRRYYRSSGADAYTMRRDPQ